MILFYYEIGLCIFFLMVFPIILNWTEQEINFSFKDAVAMGFATSILWPIIILLLIIFYPISKLIKIKLNNNDENLYRYSGIENDFDYQAKVFYSLQSQFMIQAKNMVELKRDEILNLIKEGKINEARVKFEKIPICRPRYELEKEMKKLIRERKNYD